MTAVGVGAVLRLASGSLVRVTSTAPVDRVVCVYAGPDGEPLEPRAKHLIVLSATFIDHYARHARLDKPA